MKLQIKGFGDKARYLVDGVEVPEKEFWRQAPRPKRYGAPTALSHVPPNVSDSLAVHPEDVNEAREDAKRKGVPVEFRDTGEPVFTSRAQQKAYCKAYGFINKDGGYGD